MRFYQKTQIGELRGFILKQNWGIIRFYQKAQKLGYHKDFFKSNNLGIIRFYLKAKIGVL